MEIVTEKCFSYITTFCIIHAECKYLQKLYVIILNDSVHVLSSMVDLHRNLLGRFHGLKFHGILG